MFQSSLDKFAINLAHDQPRFVPVPNNLLADMRGRAYWIPLFSVKSKGKARIVFDARAANSEKTCLNEALLQGPDRNNNLRGVLQRFRCHPIACTADINNMFHNCATTDNDKRG